MKDYFDITIPAFWLAKDDAIELAGTGGTLVLQEELLAILDELDQSGCPSIHSVLLFLASTQESSEKYIVHFIQAWMKSTKVKIHENWFNLWEAFAMQVQALAKDPPDIPNWKAFVIKQIFTENLLPPHCLRHFVEQHGRLWPDENLNFRKNNNTYNQQIQDTIHSCLLFEGSLHAETLENLYHTGIESVPEPDTEVELDDTSEEEKHLLDILTNDEDFECRLLGEIAKALYPSFAIKGNYKIPQDIPLGGYADVSNKGSLERLLTSELAHDSMTLAMRIVSGEAMYLKREAPPEKIIPSRYICIDRGIRCWGTRKLLVTAAAMAVARAGDESVEAQVFETANWDDLQACSLESVNDIKSHLSNMARAMHPANALEALQEECSELNDERYLVTSAWVLKDDAFLSELKRLAFANPIHLLSVEDDAWVELQLFSKFGQRSLLRQRIAIEKLFEQCKLEKPTEQSSDKDLSDLPSFYSQYPLPLCMPTPFKKTNATALINGGFVGKNKWGDLIYSRKPSELPQLLSTSSLLGSIDYASLQSERICLIHSHGKEFFFSTVCLVSGKLKSVEILIGEDLKHPGFFIDEYHLFITSLKKTLVYDHAGELLGTDTTEVDRCCGRFVRRGYDWFMVNYGMSLKFIPIDKGKVSHASSVFNYESNGQLYRITASPTHVLDSAGNTYYSSETNPFTNAFSARGNILTLENGFFDMDRRYVISQMGNEGPDACDFWRNGPSMPDTLRNIQKLAIAENGDIVLITLKNTSFVLSIDTNNRHATLSHQADMEELEKFPFELRSQDQDFPSHISTCQHPNGFDYFFDKRGFLHCVSSSFEEEVCFLLIPGLLTGWCREHGVFGNSKLCNRDKFYNPTPSPPTLQSIWRKAVQK